ncbi:Uncharacterized protein Mb0984 [Geodia barretti]|uniref:Uncharacterized protein Mb0984 n=1 Tax=Geodia barretti TaxID=519541 RepID=A0AA35X695_GEOBA|nr:Uncharacterized protein Mb0984 [Geodia barretti]
MLFRTYRYSKWDGTQNIFDIDADELMDMLSEDVLNNGDIMQALRDLLRQGMQNRDGEQMPGMRQLMEQLKERRRQQMQQHNMDSVVDDLKERLQEIIDTERRGIQNRLDEARQQVDGAPEDEQEQQEALFNLLEQRANRNLDKLDNLPEGVGSQLKELMEYDFMDPEAQQKFQELLDMLKSQMAQNMGQQMQQQIQNMSPEDMEATREMMRDINQMMRDRLEGREPDFDGFMDKWGQICSRCWRACLPEARQEMEDALAQALDPETQREMAQFAALMEQLMPMDDLRRQYPFLGDDSLSMEQAMQMMRDLQQLDQLEAALQEAIRTGDLTDIDPEKLAELLGDDARRVWDELENLRKLLEDAGYITGGEKTELTARGMRRIGQKALKEVFAHLKKDRIGGHLMDTRGANGDLLGETKTYEFGDPFLVDLQTTVKNAVLRGGPQVPVKLGPQDFEIHRTEHMTKAATVVLLDQSRSMGLFNNWQAAKKVTVALMALIRSQYPRDALYIVGFSDYAREIKEEDLASCSWNAWVSGTNLHHALLLSRKLLSREKGGTRQILEDILINTFMLENNYQLVNFVDRMTRINKGRAFYTSASNLSEFVLVDYLNNRRKRVTS